MGFRFETGVQSHEVFDVLRHNFFSQRRSRIQKDHLTHHYELQVRQETLCKTIWACSIEKRGKDLIGTLCAIATLLGAKKRLLAEHLESELIKMLATA
jgi:hypothetical protein